MYTKIHEIAYYGRGGYSWDIVYNMPIWLRKFTYNKVSEEIKKENDRNKPKSSKDTQNIDPLNPKKSENDITPDYVTKASKK